MKTIRQALQYVKDNIEMSSNDIQLVMAFNTIDHIENNLDQGKTLDDEIEFN